MAINNVEFLRSLMDFLDTKSAEAPTMPSIILNIEKEEQVQRVRPKVEPEQPPAFIPGEDGEEVETALDRDDVFIPPLQAKLEMMKKLAGIEPKNQELLDADDEPFEG